MFRLRLALLSLSICALQPIGVAASESVTLRYTISSNGQVAGHEVDTYLPDGHVQSTFEFNDRGRGPKISANDVSIPTACHFTWRKPGTTT